MNQSEISQALICHAVFGYPLPKRADLRYSGKMKISVKIFTEIFVAMQVSYHLLLSQVQILFRLFPIP